MSVSLRDRCLIDAALAAVYDEFDVQMDDVNYVGIVARAEAAVEHYDPTPPEDPDGPWGGGFAENH